MEAYFRVIDEPVLRLTSVDLGATADVTSLAEVFDFARDYLGLLKAGVIAAGIVPPGMEGAQQPLAEVLAKLTGTPGRGIEIVSQVNGIPKGSRLAVSTKLLACIIAVCMRATSQIRALTGGLAENERRLVAARAILGEWLGGSGGGWQDSGGVWPGMKTDSRRGRRGGRSRVRRQPRLSAAAPPRPRRTTRFPPTPASCCRTAWCWCMAAWRRTSGRSSKWSPRNTCCARRPNGRAASRPSRTFDEILGLPESG